MWVNTRAGAAAPGRGGRARFRSERGIAARVDHLEPRVLLAADTVAATSFLQTPLAFEANDGQTAATVNYLAHGAGYTLFLTPDAAVFNLLPAPGSSTGAVLRMQIVGGDASAVPTGYDRQSAQSNAIIGNDPSQWQTGITNYGSVAYQNVYPGVAVDYYGNQGQLEYDFVVAPGADPGAIALQYQGADSLSLDSQGDLLVATAAGNVTVHAPNLYQNVNGVQQNVSGSFELLGGDEVGFRVGNYDPSLPLVIDPALTYSTYLGGSLGDQAFAVAMDSSGNAYVTGETGSNDFPSTTGAYSTLLNQSGNPGNTVTDAFVTKFNTAGQLVYSTFIGGTSDDHGTGIAVDQFGYAYICGWTGQSTDYPTTPGAFQPNYDHGQDGFVTKLSQDGKSLVYSTYLGGGADDEPHAIAVDSTGNAYIVGDTYSTDFPTKNPIQGGTFNTNDDAFLAKLNSSGTALVYSTYIRGSQDDAATGVAVDPQGEAIVVGYTDSTDFPVSSGAFQAARGGGTQFGVMNTFVTKVNAAGTGYVYSTYLGGSVGVLFDVSNGGAAVATDAAGDAYVAGSTSDPDFPTTIDAAQQVFNYTDMFGLSNAYVAKFSPSGGLDYSTYLGGGGLNTSSGATAIAVDSQGYAYVTGYTADTSTPFPIAFPIQTTPGQPASYVKPGNYDAFVTRVTPDGSSFDYSSYLGGQTYDYGRGIAVDTQGNVVVVGVSRSFASAGGGTPASFPTLNAIKSTPPSDLIGDRDGFVSRVSLTEQGAGTFYFPFVTYETTEAGSFVTIQVDRRDGDAVAASVNYSVSNGTAKSGTNYQTQAGTLSFPVGVHVETFTVPILDDHVNDGTPFLVFHLALSNPTAGAVIDNTASTADVHIYDVETTNTNNDLYDNAVPIVGTNATAMGNNDNATTNAGGDDIYDFPVTDSKSPSNPKNDGGASVWWIWAPTASGVTTIDTSGSNFDTLLTVFSYGHVIENDDAPGVSDGTSKVTFEAHAGLVYRICVQGYDYGGGASTGNITLHVNEVSSGTIQLGQATFSVNENGGSIAIPVTRTGGSSGAVSVQFNTSGGTATAGTDYTAITNQTLNWASGDTSTKTITINIPDPHIAGGSKTVNLALSSPTGGASLGSPSTAVLTIVDNETPGTVQFSSATYNVNENGGSIAINLTRTGGTFGAASVQLSTGGGTATAGVDYTAVTNQTVNWSDGDSNTKTVTIPILDPHLTSGSKTVDITLSGITGAALGNPATAVLTINDNEALTAPSPPMLAASSDTGVSQTDGITRYNGSASAPLTFTVSGVGPPDGYVQLFDDTNPANPMPLGTPVQASGGNATVILQGGPGLPLADGVYQIAAASESSAGGTPSALSSTTPITIQTSLTITASNPNNNTVVTALPGGVVTLTFSHPLAGLTNGTSALGSSDPYGVFLLARGPSGTFAAPGTSTSTAGYYVGNLPLHTNATYTVNGNTSMITLTPTIPLSTDVYLLSITLSDFSDLAGNVLTDPSGGGYRSFLLQLPPVNNQALKVTSVTTYNGATVVENNPIVQPDTLAIAFNRPLYGPSVTTGNVQLLAKSGSTYTVVPSVPAYSPSTNTIYLTPTAQLNKGTTYLIRVAGKDTASTPANKYVSDDQGYGNPGNPLGATFYDSFTVTTNPASAGTGPLNVATGAGGAPATLPASNVIWTKPMGYASIGFTEAVNLSTIGRYSVMLVPESLTPSVAPLAPNIPLNTSLAFNPNTNQLIAVSTALTGNNLLYVYSLQGFQGHDGSPLLDNGGHPAGLSGNAPYYSTFELATGGSHALVAANPNAANPVTNSEPIAPRSLGNLLAAFGRLDSPLARAFRRSAIRGDSVRPPQVRRTFVPSGVAPAGPMAAWRRRHGSALSV